MTVVRGRQIFDRDFARDDAAQARDITVRSYAVRADSVNEKARTVDAVLATENPVLVFDMRQWRVIREILVIDGMGTLPDQVPLLDSHDRSTIKAQLGSTRAMRTEKGQLVGTRHFSTVDDANDAFTKVREGHLRDGSIGYRVLRYQDLEPSTSVTLNGRTFSNTGEDTLRITYEWQPIEDSLTPIGADPAAKIRNDPTPATTRAAETPKESAMKLEDLIALYGEGHRALLVGMLAQNKSAADIARAVIEAERASAVVGMTRVQPTQPTQTTPVQGDESVRAAAIAEERTRVAAIEAAAGNDIPVAMVRKAIAEGHTVARANADFLAEMRRARGTPITEHSAVQPADDLGRALETALVLRTGADPASARMAQFRDKDGILVEDKKAVRAAEQFRGIGMQDLARIVLRSEGVDAPVHVDALFKRSVSTISLPNILGAALGKSLLAGYEETPSTILAWASKGEVKDFIQRPVMKLGKFARPAKVGAGGEIGNGTLEESKENQQANTYGTRFTITRRDFINDSLGAFTRVPFELGQSMKRNIDDVGYDLLISASGVGPTMGEDAKALFHTAHADGANYIASAVTLTGAGLTQLKTLMRKMKQGTVSLNLVPRILLVPPELESDALVLVNSQQVAVTTTTDTPKGTNNPHYNKFTVVVEPRLSAATNGTTAWYLVCEPSQARSLEVCYLAGNPNPTVERKDPADVLGLGWWTYHDVGVDALDFRGIARSKGA